MYLQYSWGLTQNGEEKGADEYEFRYAGRQEESCYGETRNRLGALADIPIYSIPYPQIKKIAALKDRIWGL